MPADSDYTIVNAFLGAYDNDEWSVNKKDYMVNVLQTYESQSEKTLSGYLYCAWRWF